MRPHTLFSTKSQSTQCSSPLQKPWVEKKFIWNKRKTIFLFQKKSTFAQCAVVFRLVLFNRRRLTTLCTRCTTLFKMSQWTIENCVICSCSKTLRAPKCVSQSVKTLSLSSAFSVKSRCGTPNYESGAGTDDAPVTISDACMELTLRLVENKQLKKRN